MRKNNQFLAIIFLFLAPYFADSQVHVRGYTRKDGTYVRPHTRSSPGSGSSYSSGSSSNSYTSSYLSSSSGTTTSTYNDLRKIRTVVNGNTRSIPYKSFKDGAYKISPDITLVMVSEYSGEVEPFYEASSSKSSPTDTTSMPVYLSTIRVNGKLIDAVPFTRDLFGKKLDMMRSFNHVINRASLTSEQVIELIDKYNFKLNGDELSKSMSITSKSSMSLPSYVTHRLEVMRVQ